MINALIVKSNTMYGLNVYDYIVLDSTTVDANAKSAEVTEADNADDNEDSSDAVIDESSSLSST